MRTTIQFVLAMIREAFLIRTALHLENLALRQQLAALKRDKAKPSLRMLEHALRFVCLPYRFLFCHPLGLLLRDVQDFGFFASFFACAIQSSSSAPRETFPSIPRTSSGEARANWAYDLMPAL